MLTDSFILQASLEKKLRAATLQKRNADRANELSAVMRQVPQPSEAGSTAGRMLCQAVVSSCLFVARPWQLCWRCAAVCVAACWASQLIDCTLSKCSWLHCQASVPCPRTLE